MIRLFSNICIDIFPLKLNYLLALTGLPFFTDPEKILHKLLTRIHEDQKIPAADPFKFAHRTLQKNLSVQVKKILPRLKEGGAYARVFHGISLSPSDVEAALRQYLKKKSPKPWFSPFRGISSHLVRGKPWLEDLHRFPNKRLKVEFLPTSPGAKAAKLPEETLYGLFRTYGKLEDINPRPTESKDPPNYAILSYGNIRDAIMAKNCMHGFVLSESEGGGKYGTMLKTIYEQRAKAHAWREWIFNHPRIVIPVLAALVGSMTFMVFDPLVIWPWFLCCETDWMDQCPDILHQESHNP